MLYAKITLIRSCEQLWGPYGLPNPLKLEGSHPAEAVEVGKEVQHIQIIIPLCALLIIYSSGGEGSDPIIQILLIITVRHWSDSNVYGFNVITRLSFHFSQVSRQGYVKRGISNTKCIQNTEWSVCIQSLFFYTKRIHQVMRTMRTSRRFLFRLFVYLSLCLSKEIFLSTEDEATDVLSKGTVNTLPWASQSGSGSETAFTQEWNQSDIFTGLLSDFNYRKLDLMRRRREMSKTKCAWDKTC